MLSALTQSSTESMANTASNVTDLYKHIQALRAANALKCGKQKCDNIRQKVKKINKSVKFLETLNVTQLNESLSTISNFSTTITNLETSVTAANTNASQQQTEIDTVKSSVTTLGIHSFYNAYNSLVQARNICINKLLIFTIIN